MSARNTELEAATAELASSLTDQFYEKHAADYAVSTRSADLSAAYSHFLPRLQPNARILDVGCGSGRDLKAFSAAGFTCTGIDASSSICAVAAAYAGVPCHAVRVEEIAYYQAFDGIWACASLLHLSRAALPQALRRLEAALVPNGIAYASVQFGSGERVIADGRAYTDYQREELCEVVTQVGFIIEECWVSDDTLKRASVPWLNIIVRKSVAHHSRA